MKCIFTSVFLLLAGLIALTQAWKLLGTYFRMQSRNQLESKIENLTNNQEFRYELKEFGTEVLKGKLDTEENATPRRRYNELVPYFLNNGSEKLMSDMAAIIDLLLKILAKPNFRLLLRHKYIF